MRAWEPSCVLQTSVSELNMKWTPIRRMFIALGVSIVANILFFLSKPNSRLERFADTLNAPLNDAATWIGWSPSVHNPDVILVLLLVIVYYALPVWIVISLPVWWRNRA